jgi:uncharacterized membrane protein/protein-disulfide isomerase
MTPRLRWLLVASALIGLAVSGASIWVHYRLLTDPTYISPCDVGATFNCTEVYLSRYGSMAGVPVAVGGVIWFGLAGLIAWFARADGRPSAAAAYLTVLGILGLGVSLYLAYVSWFVLKSGCLLCMATYAAVLAILVLASRASAVPMGSLPGRVAGDLRSALSRSSNLAATLVYAAAVVALIVFFPHGRTFGEAEDSEATSNASIANPAATTPAAATDSPFAQWWFKQPRTDLGIAPEGARVIVVKFNDFACGSCAQAHYAYRPVFNRFEKSHPGAVRLVVKDWPWDVACNFNSPRTIPGHEAACAAAAAARMAQDRGKYDEMATWLYQNQNQTLPQVQAAAAKILGVKDFDREYALKLPAIRADIADGGALGIDGTPTYFVNGVRLAGLLRPEQFEMAISLELQK